MSTDKQISTQTVVDLTVDVGNWGGPIELELSERAKAKVLGANDAFFDTWEDCLFIMPIVTPDRIIVHCMVNAGDVTSDKHLRRLQSQYGWVLGYFQDVMKQ